ncbi:MAG TPA: hypothetical protein VGL69_18310 [Solirubrobacteraceae bacterium]
MNRERIGAALLRAYPAETRAARGAEMLGTLLDSSADSTVAFAREAVDLVRLGLRARATRLAAGGAPRLVADGACLAGVFFLAQDLATALHSRDVPDAVYSPAAMTVLVVVLITAMAGHDRIAGLGALVWTALRFSGVMAGIDAAGYPAAVLPVICFTVMVVSPRRRRARALLSNPCGSWWLVALVVLAGAFGGLFATLALAAAATFAGIAAALLSTDPRPAIAVALVAANVGIAKIGSDRPALMTLTLLAAAPVVVALTVGRTRHLVRAGE